MKILRNRLLPLGAAFLLLIEQAAHGQTSKYPPPPKNDLADLFGNGGEIQGDPLGWQATYTQQPQQPLQIPLMAPPIRHKTVMSAERGGKLDEHWNRFKALYLSGHYIEIRGRCPSACTLVTGVIPKDRLCFAEGSSLLFHWAREYAWNGPPSRSSTQWVIDHYPADLREWIDGMGGIDKLPKDGYWVLPASILWGMGYRSCGA